MPEFAPQSRVPETPYAGRLSQLVARAAAALLLGIYLGETGLAGQSGRAAAISFGFACAALLLRGVNVAGAMAGGAIAYIYLASGGWPLFSLLLCTFLVTLIATKIAALGPHANAPNHDHRGRTEVQVVANLLVAATIVVLYAGRNHLHSMHWILWMVLAANAELAADTVSSEVGTRFGVRTFLFPAFAPTIAGTNGGVSVAGTIAGLAAAAIICLCGMFLPVAPLRYSFAVFGVTFVAAAAGMFFDSFLGSRFEREGALGNNSVNLLGTAMSALVCYALMVIFR